MSTEFSLLSFGDLPEARGFSVRAGYEAKDGFCELHWEVQGPLDEIVLASKSPAPKRKDKLWETSCFEFFWGETNKPTYEEWNFSSSLDWARYNFSNPRQRESDRAEGPTALRFEQVSTHLGRMTATIALPLAVPTVFNLSCVLEHSTRSRSYWALAHPEGQPDFHNRNLWKDFI